MEVVPTVTMVGAMAKEHSKADPVVELNTTTKPRLDEAIEHYKATLVAVGAMPNLMQFRQEIL